MLNKQCTCKFISNNTPMDSRGCEVHAKDFYVCDRCGCFDYRPKTEPKPNGNGGFYWPLCECGHMAQEHN